MTIYPKLEFHSDVKSMEVLSYRIEEKEEQIYYGKATKIISGTDKNPYKHYMQRLEEMEP